MPVFSIRERLFPRSRTQWSRHRASRGSRGAAVAAALLASIICLPGGYAATIGGSHWGGDYLPNVTVLNQNGEPVKFYDDVVKGKIVVISFIYTSCSNICPLVTARLTEVKEKLGDAVGRNIQFVSISIDPIPDTPAKLKAMSDAFRTGSGWTFLTGAPEDIDAIRYKLGERSRQKTDHRNEILLGNAATGEWERSSAFGDLDILANTIRSMDPAWREQRRKVAQSQDHVTAQSVGRPGQALFVKACASCHTVGNGPKVGPDLAGVTTRHTREWVKSYLMNPEGLRTSGDPGALDLRGMFPSVRMPNLGLTEADAADLLDYIENGGLARTASDQQVHGH